MYHKYKNYESIYAGTAGGVKNGFKFGLIAAGFTLSEQLMEHYITGGESWACTTASGVLTGTGFALTRTSFYLVPGLPFLRYVHDSVL